MKGTIWLGCGLLLFFPLAAARAGALTRPFELVKLNERLCGKVVDHTDNHGTDRRIWSPALCKKRDLYVYLPPGFDPSCPYPLMIWMHGMMQDERSFLLVAQLFDQAIRKGQLAPLIIAAPDGSIEGDTCMDNAGSFFINSKAGRFEDYVMHDVWNFVHEHYLIRPEREAHLLAGASMGGYAAFNLGMKYRDRVKVVMGLFPPLNLRWVDCHGRYKSDFDPCCWGWRTHLNPREVLARFIFGLVPIRIRHLTDPLVGRGPDAIPLLSQENPIEMLDRLELQPGELDMFVGYGTRDEYNVDAQVESFLVVARRRGLCVQVAKVPKGRHNSQTGVAVFPAVIEWLAPKLAPFACCPAIDPSIP